MYPIPALILAAEADSATAQILAEILADAKRLSVQRHTLPGIGPPLDGVVLEPPPSLLFLVHAAGPVPRELVEDLRAPKRDLLVVVGAGRPEDITELLGAGAADFLLPPLSATQVLPRVRRLLDRAESPPGPRDRLRRELKERVGLRDLIGESPRFREELRKVRLVASCDVEVLLSGPTGTGKELCARAIHYLGQRADRPFVAVNCGALPLELVENELFGHRGGAFTGAAAAAPGLVQEAEQGTLFLDEIDTLAPMAQVKLLRFLQEREYRPLGSTRMQRADVRVIAATNSEPEGAVETGRLRRDLFYRLSVVQVRLPSLAERREDLPSLAQHFLARSNRRFGRSVEGFSPGALQALAVHSWPGNVRELQHVVERAVVLSDGARALDSRDLELP